MNIFTTKKIILACALATSAVPSFAGPMLEVELIGQPLSYSKNGVTDGCGVRVVGNVPIAYVSKDEIRTFDVSSGFWNTGVSAVKMVAYSTKFDGAKATSSPKRIPLYGGWLKAEGKSPAAPQLGGFTEGSEKGSYLFPVQSEGALAFIASATGGQRVQIAIAWNKGVEWVYYGTIKLSESEREQLLLCMKEIFN